MPRAGRGSYTGLTRRVQALSLAPAISSSSSRFDHVEERSRWYGSAELEAVVDRGRRNRCRLFADFSRSKFALDDASTLTRNGNTFRRRNNDIVIPGALHVSASTVVRM